MEQKLPDFTSTRFLKQHILDTINFYAPRCIDKVSGGYINCFLDDGTVCDYETKQLVGQARFVFIFSAAALLEPGQATGNWRNTVLRSCRTASATTNTAGIIGN